MVRKQRLRTVAEVADVLRISTRQVRNWVDDGLLKKVDLSQHRGRQKFLIVEDSVRAMIMVGADFPLFQDQPLIDAA